VKGDSDYAGRGMAAFILAHTLVCLGAGYFIGYLSGVDEGTCRSTCEEATAGMGSGHVAAEGCTCTIIDMEGAKTTWVEKTASAP
jgi:hypothetical protein